MQKTSANAIWSSENTKHPICSNTNNYNHGTGTVAMVATLIIPTLQKFRTSPKRAKTAAKVQRRSKILIHGQREPIRKWLAILTFMTITICLIHRCIYVSTQQQHIPATYCLIEVPVFLCHWEQRTWPLLILPNNMPRGDLPSVGTNGDRISIQSRVSVQSSPFQSPP